MRFVSSLLIHINTSTHGGAVDGYYLPYPAKLRVFILWPDQNAGFMANMVYWAKL